MDNIRQETKNNKKIIAIFIAVIAVCVALMIIVIRIKPEVVEVSEFSAIKNLCENATLMCYYHNVAEYKSGQESFLGLGYEKYWIEYNGIIKYGIDMQEVEVNEPDDNGVVKIYVPNAKVLECNVDESSMQKPITDTGIFASITIDEKSKAYANAQQTMKQNAENDKEMLNRAKENAKEILVKFVLDIGKQIGENYKIEWLTNPIKK